MQPIWSTIQTILIPTLRLCGAAVTDCLNSTKVESRKNSRYMNALFGSRASNEQHIKTTGERNKASDGKHFIRSCIFFQRLHAIASYACVRNTLHANDAAKCKCDIWHITHEKEMHKQTHHHHQKKKITLWITRVKLNGKKWYVIHYEKRPADK